MIQQAYRFALDPTPRQARMFASHAGGARFAYNWGIRQIADALDAREAEKAAGAEPTTPVPDHFSLCKAWTAWKDQHADDPEPAEGERSTSTAWVAENFTGTYQAALRDAAKAWADYFKSAKGERKGRKLGRPRFKKRGKCRDSFQLHGDGLRIAGKTKIVLPKIGTVTVMSDDSMHPAMRRSRSRATVEAPRHMGNRRRSDHLWRHMRQSGENAARLAVLLREARERAGLGIAEAVTVLGAETDARVTAEAQAMVAAAEASVSAAEDADALRKARAKLQYAQVKLRKLGQQAPGEKAPRTRRWTAARLAALEKTGEVTDLEHVSVICAAYRLDGRACRQVMDLAAQARIVRATITLGADGLWWCSAGAEVPHQVRAAADPVTGEKAVVPSRAQREGGLVGVDFGVREIITASNGECVPNPRHLKQALAELRAAQKHLSRCQPGSKRQEKAKRRVGLIHADVARLRDMALHRATTAMVRRHDVIAVEGWDVQQVMRSGSGDVPRLVRRNRNRALADTGVGMGRQMLIYKGRRAGVIVMVADPQAKTGRTCSVDGKARTTPLPPGQELFTSDRCAHVMPRRENTAKALAAWARQELSKRGPSPGGPAEPRGGGVRPGTARRDRQLPVKRAASTRPGRDQTGIPGG